MADLVIILVHQGTRVKKLFLRQSPDLANRGVSEMATQDERSAFSADFCPAAPLAHWPSHSVQRTLVFCLLCGVEESSSVHPFSFFLSLLGGIALRVKAGDYTDTSRDSVASKCGSRNLEIVRWM